MNTLFRALPSMDVCLAALLEAKPAWAEGPRALLRDIVTEYWDAVREDIRAGRITDAAEVSLARCLPALCRHTAERLRPKLRRTLNATGVVIHTNMGRSVLAQEAVDAVAKAAEGYSNLELNLATGERGGRYALVEELICRISGAEAATVVNNNAAAVLLVLDTFCKGGEVVVSRGELVEIGGSFRIPEVMEKSGAVLREVGATNRTHLHDYARAITENTRALMRVHTSNYRIVGFHKAVRVEELVSLGREHGLPVIEDLGSGSFMDFSPCGLPGEPTVQSVVAAGADIVTFSGDKVLGGPQAGIIVGTKHAIAALRANPLTRALRQDKLCLAALEATLRLHLDAEQARRRVPTLRMMTTPPADLARRARALARTLRRALGSLAHISLKEDSSRVGGGSFPEYGLPTTLVCVRPAVCSAAELKTRLLATDPPLLGRVEDDTFCLDVRTLAEQETKLAAQALTHALANTLA